MEGAAFLQGRVCRIPDRRSTFATSSTDLEAGAALSQGPVWISWQEQRSQKTDERQINRQVKRQTNRRIDKIIDW